MPPKIIKVKIPEKNSPVISLQSPQPFSANLELSSTISTLQLEVKKLAEAMERNKYEVLNKITVFENMHLDLLGKLAEVNSTLISMELENKDLKAKIAELEDSHSARILKLERGENHREQVLRSNNIEIAGYPESPNECATQIAIKVSGILNINIKENDIVSAHRVRHLHPSRSPKCIIVKLKEPKQKDEIIAGSRRKKGINHSELGLPGLGKIYINNHLTITNKQILRKTREAAKKFEFSYVWEKNGFIFARKDDLSPFLRISSEEEVDKLLRSSKRTPTS
jgi:hypothetical protein